LISPIIACRFCARRVNGSELVEADMLMPPFCPLGESATNFEIGALDMAIVLDKLE